MITSVNFESVLKHLGFAAADVLNPDRRTRTFRKGRDGQVDCVLAVDLSKKRFEYEEAGIDIGGGTTVGFAPDASGIVQNENFVVFECVVRLLEKGYRSSDIFLEKKHTLGHSQKSGRLDITVAKDGASYLVIECKTAGAEYRKARKELLGDPAGKQLFSYWAQARSTKWLQLYASDWDAANGTITFEEEIVRSHDDRNIELLAAKDPAIALYKSASEATDAWRVWDETYQKETYRNLVFGDSCQAYAIGIQPLVKRDLRRFTQEDGFTNTFLEILRHNAISDKENAFNKLLSLFICKFVDEARCGDSDVVAFQYKEGQDDYYSLYERLLALFQIGMKDYLKEEVFYLEDDYIAKTLDTFTGKRRKALEAELRDKFQKTKMLSCQVFAFREVYNETLFLQNGKVLVEIVKLMQQYQFAYSSKEQLLGDLFEKLLNQGFKQESGQFFTPTPITRFVWNALPVGRFVDTTKKTTPRVIDFACGSGHFLTEGIAAVSDFYRAAGVSPEQFPDAEISRSFFGIEKDNRLAKVSKIALILNGALEGNVKAADGLERDEEFLGPLHSFDILVANPPFSVDSFKAHESIGVQKAYDTIALMSLDCNRIQNVFVERMENLLKPGGLAAIVLPSSFLSNNESDTVKAREILIRNFALRAIAELGGKAFAKTPSTTVVLFLEHFDFPPQKAVILDDTADAILSGETLSDWEDRDVFAGYLAKIGVSEEDYRAAMSETSAPDALAPDYFKAYCSALFSKGALAKDAEKARKETDPAKKADALKRVKDRFYEALKETERAKLLAFALVRAQKTVVIKTPVDNDEQKRFLGYSFSDRRSAEGLSEADTGELTNKADRADKTKIAHAVQNAFAGNYALPGGIKHVSVVRTADTFDFSRPAFQWEIITAATAAAPVQSMFPLVRLGGVVAAIVRGVTFDKTDQVPEETANIVLTAENITLDGRFQIEKKVYLRDGFALPTEKRLRKDDCFMCFASGSKAHVGKVCLIDKDTDFYAGGFMGILRANTTKILPRFLHEILNASAIREIVQKSSKGTNIQNLSGSIAELQIPLPLLAEQKQVVDECAAVDADCAAAEKAIADRKTKITAIMTGVKGDKRKLESLLLRVNGGSVKIPESHIKETGSIPVVTQETDKLVSGYTETDSPIDDLPLIVFGDHSCTFKYIDFPFVRGADGTQLIKTDSTIVNAKFLCEFLKTVEIHNASKYERHFKYLKDTPITLPLLAEQKRIVALVEKEETAIAAERKVLADAPARKAAILAKHGVIL